MWFFRKRAKKGQQYVKKGKIFENLGKNVQNLKIFWKRAGGCVQLSHANKPLEYYIRPWLDKNIQQSKTIALHNVL